MPNNKGLIPAEIIESKILLLRGKKVILDRDLASLYGVETKQLKRAVKRNNDRFPPDFMFQVNSKELCFLRCHFGTLEDGQIMDKRGKHSKYLPYAFTEQGVAMLSSVLNSKKAILVNIQIMRTFTKLRKIILTHKDLQIKIERIIQQQEKQAGKMKDYDQQITVIFEAIKQLIQNDEIINKRLTYEEEKQSNKKWGFQPPGK